MIAVSKMDGFDVLDRNVFYACTNDRRCLLQEPNNKLLSLAQVIGKVYLTENAFQNTLSPGKP